MTSRTWSRCRPSSTLPICGSAFSTNVTYRGHHFGLPWSADVRTLFYNNDALLEVGLDPERPPTSWDEFHDAINKTFKKEAGQHCPSRLRAVVGQRRLSCRLDDPLLAAGRRT